MSPEWGGIAQVYQADLAKIGVTLVLKPVDPVTLNAEVRQHTYNSISRSSTRSTQRSRSRCTRTGATTRWIKPVATQVATQTALAAMTPEVHDLKYTLVEMLDYRDVWLDA